MEKRPNFLRYFFILEEDTKNVSWLSKDHDVLNIFREIHKGWSQIGISSKFIPFDSKNCDSTDSKRQKIFEKFVEN